MVVQSASIWRRFAEDALKNPDLESLAETNEALDAGEWKQS